VHPVSDPPLTDAHRLSVVAGIDLDDPELRQKLNAITERTAGRLGMPISLVSVVSHVAQDFIGSYGLDGWMRDAQGTPVEWSFCRQAVTSRRPYTVPDARVDARQSSNPLVTEDGIRSYAGVPLMIDREVIGTLCVLDTNPRVFTEADLEELASNAEEVTALLRERSEEK
jgi:GAF domain-containing protein